VAWIAVTVMDPDGAELGVDGFEDFLAQEDRIGIDPRIDLAGNSKFTIGEVFCQLHEAP
jgi:hypothetical protein